MRGAPASSRHDEMAAMTLKAVSTRLAKQVSGYSFLMHDMQFASRVFSLAATLETRTPAEILATRASPDARMRQLLELDPLLRAGAVVAQIDPDDRTDGEIMKAALFEAGIVTYGRCFASGQRTRLFPDIFRGYPSAKKLHQALMTARNKHIAHSELKMERSIVGCKLVEDASYGERPHLVMSTMLLRRHVPPDERLAELPAHCDAIVERVIHPKHLDAVRALREELRLMPPEKFDALPDFAAETTVVDELL
jgi:hypothetical protein